MDRWVRRWRGAGWTALLAVGLMVLTSPLARGQKSQGNGRKDISPSWSAGGSVSGLSVSADGKRIVAVVSPSTLKMWDSRGKELLSIRVPDFLNAAAISADGKRLAGGSVTGGLRIWDAEGKERLAFKAHSNAVRCVAFSPDGKHLATASQDRTAKLWDAQTGKKLQELSHPHYVLSVAFSPDGKRLATGGQDNAARLWDAESGKELLVRKNLSSEVACVTFSPDGERFATGCWKLIQVWDAATGKVLASIQGETGWSQGVAFSPDGKYLATGADGSSVGVWDSRSGKKLFVLRGHTDAVRALAFAADGKSLISSGPDQSVRVWDFSRPEELILRNGPSEKGEVLHITGEITVRSLKDRAFGGNHAAWVPVPFTKGKTYQIDMSGISLGSLRLEDPSGKHLTSDSGSAGSSRPRIIHQAQKSGRYRIVCTSWHLRPETGRFTLIVKETTSDPKELARPIELWLKKGRAAVEAELELRGPRYKTNPCRFLTITLKAGATYRVQMSSREFLSYVFVEDPDGKLLGENHTRSGDARPASITFKAVKAGTYRLIAAQYDFRTGGPQFSLSVEELKAP